MAETILIELVVDDSQLQPAIDQLEKTGQIDAKLAGAFKQTTAEINKQTQAIKASADSATPLKKNLEDVSKTVKNTALEFIKGFQEGVTDTLKEAGVSIIQLKKALGTFNPASPFEKLNKSLSDTTKRVLDTSARLEQLRRTGGEGTEAFRNLEKQLKADQNELKRLGDEMARVKQATDLFEESENGAGDAGESLRQRLKVLTQQIQQLKIENKDNTDEFRALVKEAGEVQDAIGDVGQEIKNAAANSQALEGLLSAAQGIAGGFAVAQGTAALFGDESEELQKTLLKVNAAMAILQGLQQIQNVLQKESAASQLLANRQRLITNAQIAIENGLNSTSIVVRTAAAGAQKVLNAAMAANPIGILVVAIAGLITLLGSYGASAAEARRQTSNLNVALDAGAKAFEDRANAIKQQGDEIIKNLESEGAIGSKLAQQEIDNQKLIVEAREQRLAELRELEDSNTEADIKKRQELNAAIRALDDQLLIDTLAAGNLEVKLKRALLEEDLKSRVATTEAALQSAKEGSKEQLALQKQLITQRAALELNADGLLQAQRLEIQAKAEKERQELQVAFDKRRIDLQLRNLDTQLVNVREGSQEEFNLRIQQLRLQVQAEITSTKLSESEKRAIKEKGFQDELKLQREFNAKLRREAIEGQISLNAAQLSSIQTSAEDRLLLSIANIELAAQVEIDAAKDNANKIKEIIAKREADILALRKAAIEVQAQQEIDLITAREGINNRSLQRISQDEKQSVRTRITAIQQLAEFDINNIETRERALEEERQKRLINDEEYNLRYAQLQDEKARVSEDAEHKITGIHKSEAEKRKQINQQLIQSAIEVSQQVVDILGQLSDLQTQRDEQRLEGERARVQELLESGAITEKEAIARNKRIDAEEKKVKREAAQRDKNIAIFNAVINTAAAVTKALPNLILAGIAAALGAAQIAIIASRPIPKFKGGKKNRYEGPGIIGEDGAEIFEHDGKRYIAHKETLVWLGKEDKVYTPQETKRMLPRVDRELMKPQYSETFVSNDIDYDALGKAVGKHVKVPGITIDENGFKAWQQDGLSRTKYMDKYYSSPK